MIPSPSPPLAHRKALRALVALALLTACAGPGRPRPVNGRKEAGSEAAAAYKRLARTLNVDLRDLKDSLESRHFDEIAGAGFTAVRFSVGWANRCGAGPEYRIDPDYLRWVDWAVEQALKRRLAVVLDLAKDKVLTQDPEAGRERFFAIWRQLSEYYRGASPALMFEPFAEPNGRLDSEWNRLFAEVLALIRKDHSARVVLVGPVEWNSAKRLNDLELPSDPNLIVCVHTYHPIRFTFQGTNVVPGAREWLGTEWKGTAEEQAEIRELYDGMAAWSKARERLVFVEEFGTSDHAPLESRSRWTAFQRQEAEARGLSWGVWDFAPTFALYDLARRRWEPSLLEALFPEGPRSQ